MMDGQTVFNIVLSVAGVLGGWVLRILWDSLRDLQSADKALADKVNTIEVLVAGRYVTREEVQHMIEALFKKLDKIDSKLDGKADK